jgi:hypothetical protein
MSLRSYIRSRMPITECIVIDYFGRKCPAFHDDTVNMIANRWYRSNFKEPRFMCPSVDPYRAFTLKELKDFYPTINV